MACLTSIWWNTSSGFLRFLFADLPSALLLAMKIKFRFFSATMEKSFAHLSCSEMSISTCCLLALGSFPWWYTSIRRIPLQTAVKVSVHPRKSNNGCVMPDKMSSVLLWCQHTSSHQRIDLFMDDRLCNEHLFIHKRTLFQYWSGHVLIATADQQHTTSQWTLVCPYVSLATSRTFKAWLSQRQRVGKSPNYTHIESNLCPASKGSNCIKCVLVWKTSENCWRMPSHFVNYTNLSGLL